MVARNCSITRLPLAVSQCSVGGIALTSTDSCIEPSTSGPLENIDEYVHVVYP